MERKFYAFLYKENKETRDPGNNRKIWGEVRSFYDRQVRDVFVQQMLYTPEKGFLHCKAVTRKELNQMGYGDFFNNEN